MFLQPNFEFSSPLKCGQPAPDVLLQVFLNIIQPIIVIRDKCLILVHIIITLVTQKIINFLQAIEFQHNRYYRSSGDMITMVQALQEIGHNLSVILIYMK